MREILKEYAKETKIVGFILFFKLLIIALVPLTGDEAYFIKWATHLSSGYYDHPPMVGWLIYLMSFINESHIFFRLFSFFSALIVAFSIVKIAELYIEKKKAIFLGLLFLASPVDILMSLFTNDIPLVLFGTLGTQFLLYSLHKEATIKYAILAGVFLGGAFLSKYFSAFLLISLLVFVFSVYRTRAIKSVLITASIIFLAIAQNLYFNYNCCWNNIMFNFFARTESEYNFETFSNFLLNFTYVVTPWALYFLYKSKKNFVNNELFKLLVLILGLMFGIFFLVSLKNLMGIHWFVLFIPYIFLLFSFLDDKYLQKLFKYNSIFTYVHIALILGLLMALKVTPYSYLSKSYFYPDVILSAESESVCRQLDKYEDKELFALGYTNASLLSYFCKKDVNMLFNDSVFGRFDDKLIDLRELNQKDLYLFDNREITQRNVGDVCKAFSVESFNIENTPFYTAKCIGFDYEKYKKEHLHLQRERFYEIPEWLPVGKCYFNDRYFKEQE
ncbi:hypothetical protein GJV85_06030 [Sulfurimonas aquatica]|uniref:Glycosyltransferase RgtA/B/C/D-like domain-containing protein n=1 Tax=Sulfurimonas aquatica TaxID=2672570 RepID=A0A975AZY4_9BACT|nr:glycosyltransferase family 39 protein [Sulfurimonas aquatica]QSZ41681.1 hypothetical protein GJV85_06030 [Sulfurimonas aquatica]